MDISSLNPYDTDHVIDFCNKLINDPDPNANLVIKLNTGEYYRFSANDAKELLVVLNSLKDLHKNTAVVFERVGETDENTIKVNYILSRSSET